MTREEFRAKCREKQNAITNAKNAFAELLENRVKELNENTYKEYIGKKVEITYKLLCFTHTLTHVERGYCEGVRRDCFGQICLTLSVIRKDGSRGARRACSVVESEVLSIKTID